MCGRSSSRITKGTRRPPGLTRLTCTEAVGATRPLSYLSLPLADQSTLSIWMIVRCAAVHTTSRDKIQAMPEH